MRSRILASVALAALLSAPAFAQSSSSGSAPAPAQTESRSDSTAPATGSAAGSSATTTTSGAKSSDAAKAAPPAAGSVITTQEQSQLTADNLIGMDVRNPQDEKIGKIEDLVLDSEMKVVGVVVSVGGFLGMGKHDVALTREQVQFAQKGDKNERVATVSMTKDQLKAAPEFKTLDQQQAEAEQERAKASQGTAAGTGARPTGTGTPPATKTQ